ncbi:MAG: glycogen-binding domain-containing protein [Treponema sp.]|jgi:hypothetical protein|nr:glycogen-binding domain-containing protein [Treponema sp.]
MKTTTTAAMLLMLIIGNIGAVDIESYQFVDHLLSLPGPGVPEVFEDGVIFTAPSNHYGTVGISFAYEDFSQIYWFRRLMVPQDSSQLSPQEKKRNAPVYKDGGILFYVHTIPEKKNLTTLDYRLIIDGLWTRDPLNPQSRLDAASGLILSTVKLPPIKRTPSPVDNPPGTLYFSFEGAPGGSVTVAGTFNGWDPFMYELKEDPRNLGHYSLILPLPKGTYQYVFYHQGQRIPDPNNNLKVYTKDGMPASEAVVK